MALPPEPSTAAPPVRWGRLFSDAGVLAPVLIFVALYVCFYPPTYSILDEQAYLSYAQILASGHLFADEVGIDSLRTQQIGEHRVPAFALGTSFLLAPAARLGWRGSFAIILMVHLAGFWAAGVAIRKADLPSWWSILYLYHPVAALFARTVMSDVPTMALAMTGVAAYMEPRSRPVLAGLAWGAMPIFRFAQAPAVAVLLAAAGLRDTALSWRTRSFTFHRSALLALGLVPGLLCWGVLNMMLYGHPLRTPIAWPLSLEYLPANASRYLLSQNLVYPLGLIVGVCFRSPLRLECALLSTTMLLLYGCFRHLYVGYNTLASMIIGDRFFLPFFSLLLVPYALALRQLLTRAGPLAPWLKRLGIAALVASCVGLTAFHQQALRRQHAIQESIYRQTSPDDLIVCNHNAHEYLFEGLGRRRVREWAEIAPSSSGSAARSASELAAGGSALYFLTAARSDQGGEGAEEVAFMEDFARAHFEVVPVISVDSHSLRLRLLRLDPHAS